MTATRISDLTPAELRVVIKTREVGKIHRQGGFGDGTTIDPVAQSDFDRSRLIDKMLAAGLLTFGDAWNTYHLTDAGVALAERASTLANALEIRKAEKAEDKAAAKAQGAAA